MGIILDAFNIMFKSKIRLFSVLGILFMIMSVNYLGMFDFKKKKDIDRQAYFGFHIILHNIKT